MDEGIAHKRLLTSNAFRLQCAAWCAEGTKGWCTWRKLNLHGKWVPGRMREWECAAARNFDERRAAEVCMGRSCTLREACSCAPEGEMTCRHGYFFNDFSVGIDIITFRSVRVSSLAPGRRMAPRHVARLNRLRTGCQQAASSLSGRSRKKTSCFILFPRGEGP